jgi:hypothetical protein
MTDWKSSLRSDPIPWLLDNACAPIRYRVLTELLGLGREDLKVQEVRKEMLAHPGARQLGRTQRKDGTWGGVIHAGETKKYTACLENGVTRLYEFAWDRETKVVRDTAKTLRVFMTAKKTINLFEFAKAVKADEKRERYYRWFLRILALGLLIRAGYVEERTRLAVLELLDLTAGFVDDPVSRSPVEEIGASLPLIRSAAWKNDYAFIPDLYIIRVLAHSPWLLEGELAKMRLKKVFDYILSQRYQGLAPELGLVRTAKGAFPKGNGVKLHGLEYYQKHGQMDELLMHLELFARLGLINRYPLLMSHLEWLQSQQGKDGRWNLSTKLINDASRWTTLLRIEKDWRSPARKEADLTFRMLLIIKNQWESQISMLDRRDDGYPI